tara:strand:- start:299 stop:1186 length:888 start_codon:yes stop_codon:yes gene_type:complete
MKKINLKNILKKTFKKNKNKVHSKKKVKKFKAKKAEKIKKNKRKIDFKKNKIIPKNKLKKENETKPNEKYRISKGNELKPEIKKIKKQETEKKEYKPNQYVVYPKHGVGKILRIDTVTIGGIEVQCYVVKFEKDKAEGFVPVNKQLHLRPLSTINQVNKSISILKSKPKIKRSMWSRRAQEYEQKINSGKIYELAEVVRDLNKGDDIMVDQSYSERQLFEKAYERILNEFQIVLNFSMEDTQKKLDKALKRNLTPHPAIAKTETSKASQINVENDEVSVGGNDASDVGTESSQEV